MYLDESASTLSWALTFPRLVLGIGFSYLAVIAFIFFGFSRHERRSLTPAALTATPMKIKILTVELDHRHEHVLRQLPSSQLSSGLSQRKPLRPLARLIRHAKDVASPPSFPLSIRLAAGCVTIDYLVIVL